MTNLGEGISPFDPEKTQHSVRLINLLEDNGEQTRALKEQLSRSKRILQLAVHPFFDDDYIEASPTDESRAFVEQRDELMRLGLRGERPVVVLQERLALPSLQAKLTLLVVEQSYMFRQRHLIRLRF